VQYVCENTGVPPKRPTARDVQASPSLRRDLLSFSSEFGEPVIAPHVTHTWPLGWTVGSIGGDALRQLPANLENVGYGTGIIPVPMMGLSRARPGLRLLEDAHWTDVE